MNLKKAQKLTVKQLEKEYPFLTLINNRIIKKIKIRPTKHYLCILLDNYTLEEQDIIEKYYLMNGFTVSYSKPSSYNNITTTVSTTAVIGQTYTLPIKNLDTKSNKMYIIWTK